MKCSGFSEFSLLIAQTDASDSITGENITGKDFIAEAIHQSSNRAKGPFIKVNCGARPRISSNRSCSDMKKGLSPER